MDTHKKVSKTSTRKISPPLKTSSSGILETAMANAASTSYIAKYLSKPEIDLIKTRTTTAAKGIRERVFDKRTNPLIEGSISDMDNYDLSNLSQLIYEHYPTQMIDEYDVIEEPTIEEISLLVLCHGGIYMNIIPDDSFGALNQVDEEDLNKLIPEYSRYVVVPTVEKHSFNFPSYFSFSFDTVAYRGIYTNAISCAGMPNVKLPFPSIEDQKYVNSEEESMKSSKKNDYNLSDKKIWALCSDEGLREIDFSASSCDIISPVSKKCLNLIKHPETICNSLIVKSYSCNLSEVSEFDCGKIVMFIKVKDKDNNIFVKKFVLLGPELFKSMDNLSLMFGGRFDTAINEYLHATSIDKRQHVTNTFAIVTLLNSLAGHSVRFFDKSCNVVINNNTSFAIPSPRYIRPETPLFVMFSLINSQISNMQSQCQISVFGGKRKIKRSRRRKIYKN